MNRPLPRRLAAVAIASLLMALVVLDLSDGSFRHWWDDHALTTSIVSSLLALGVAGLIVDEVVAHRQRRDRATTVAVQGMIVHTQARLAYNAFSAVDEPTSEAPDELETLAGMLLTASGHLFDDPQARVLLEDVQRLTGLMARAVRTQGALDPRIGQRLAAQMAAVDAAAAPLRARLSAEYQALIEDLDSP